MFLNTYIFFISLKNQITEFENTYTRTLLTLKYTVNNQYELD